MDAHGPGFAKLGSSKLDEEFEIDIPTDPDQKRYRRQQGVCGFFKMRAVQVAIVGVVLVLGIVFILAAVYGHTDKAGVTNHHILPHNNRDTFNAIVIGDWGRHGTTNQSRVAALMAQVATDTDVDVIISVGDNFYTWGVHNLTDPQFNETWRDVYTQPALAGIPWHVVAGNHDWRGDVNAEVQYTNIAKRWNMPSLYFSLEGHYGDGECVGFALTDTSPYAYDLNNPAVLKKMPHLPSAANNDQVDWLGITLENFAEECGWTIAIGHHPFYSAGEHGDNLPVKDKFLPLFNRHNVASYIAGHDHDQQHIVVDGFNYFVSGAGSDVRPQMNWQHTGLQWASVDPGMLLLTIKPDMTFYQMYTVEGSLMYNFSQPVPNQ